MSEKAEVAEGPPKSEGPRAFARWLQLVADGKAHVELSTTLFDLMKKLRSFAINTQNIAKGEVLVRFKFKVEPTGIVGIGYEIKTKEPEPARPGAVMWLTKGGNLTPENPKQQDLPGIREVPQPETRTIDDDFDPVTGEVRSV
jgi:hypothetical protein